MAKIRVQDVAKELNVPVQEIMKKLEGLGIFVPNPMSTLAPAEVVKIKSLITGKKITMVKKKVVKADPKAGASKAAEPEQAAPKAASAKAEEPKKEGAKARAAKAEAAKAAPAKEAPRAEAPKAEPVKEAPREEAPRAELAKEAPRADVPKGEAPKAEPARTEKTAGDRRPQNQQDRKQDRNQERGNREKRGEDRENRGNRDGRPNRDGQGRDGERRDNRGNRDGRPNRDGRGRDGRSARDGERRYNNGEGRPARDGERRFNGEGRDNRNGEGRQDRGDRRFGGEGNREHRGNDFRGDKDGRDGQNRGQGGRRNDNRKGGSGYLEGGLAIPERPKIEDKPKKTDRNRTKEKNRNASTGEDFGRKKNNNKVTVNMLDDDMLARHRKKPKPNKAAQEKKQENEAEEIKVVTLPDSLTVKDFAEAVGKPSAQIIKALMMKGIMAGLNQEIEFEQAEELAMDMGILVEHEVEEDIFAAYTQEIEEDPDALVERPPVVVVMGHVDHGKTSLLDKIRSTKVTSGEAGGITQSIGASVVEINNRKITFLDTPGHEAFTAMRMRGAQVTDIAILVVAADDGVMPQTVEAINHAKAAGVQIIVAINKMDKPTANPDRVMQELTEHELIAEAWGGSTICVPVSAHTGQGIDELLEMVLLVADMEEYKANPNCPARGSVIEAELDRGRGAVATILVERGTLNMGDPIVVGHTYGRIKAMQDDRGRRIKTAGPSTPVEIIGLSEVPTAGEKFYVTANDREARLLAEKVSAKERQNMIEGNKKVSLDDLFSRIQDGNMKELNIVVKADTQGSVEAVKQSLEKLSNNEVAVRCIHGGVGAVSESDVILASAANAIIIGFNVRPDAGAKSVADEQKVDIRLYRVIYSAIEEIEAAMKGMLDPEFEEKVIGHAEVRQVFRASGIGTIAGSYVLDGKIQRNASARLVRDGIVVYEGELASLRRFKDDVKEVATGYECGVMLNKFTDIKEGDILEAFVMEEIKR